MNDLEKYFYSNDKRKIHKFAHYFDIYERHFARFRGKEITIVEIGVDGGGSLQMWKHYFGDKAKIIGIDIEDCTHVEEDQISIMVGDQGNLDFLREVKSRVSSKIDILIDDGSHRSPDQTLTFEMLFPCLSADGVYLCEDLQTAYHKNFGGGYKRGTSFIERMKEVVDYLHNQVFDFDPEFAHGLYEKAWCLHVYHQVVVIEKRDMHQAIRSSIMTGKGYQW